MVEIQIEDDRLSVAIGAAIEAGDGAAAVQTDVVGRKKSNDTIVTEADTVAETQVRDALTSEYEYPILGEEYGGDISDEDTYWVIDPIDGTWNFAHQQPFYGCAVALVENNRPVLGVWYMPRLDYLFYAVEGEGAYRNEEQIFISEYTEVSNMYPILSGYGCETFHHPLCEYTHSRPQQLESAVMSEAWIASGWCDVGVFGGLEEWDMAAGTVLIREAGGIVKSVRTGQTDWESVSKGRVFLGREESVNAIHDTLPDEMITTIIETEYGN